MDIRVKLTARDIFTFSMYHFYRTFAGVVSILCTVSILGVVAASWSAQPGPFRALLLLGAVLVAGCQPFIVYRKAVRQTQDPQMSQEIRYKFDHSGFKVQQGRERGVIRWSQIRKVRRIPGLYILYLDQSRAYLIPDGVLAGGKRESLLENIRSHVDSAKRRGI